MTPNSLTGTHLRTYEAIFRHSVAHNLAWRDVRGLLGAVGQLSEGANGHLKVTRQGHTLILHPPKTKEVGEPAVLMELRHFLKRSEAPAPAPLAAGHHWLLVIDHREARLYQSELRGSVPQRIRPHVTHGATPHPPHSLEFSLGQLKPDPSTFFGPVAAALGEQGKILVFGCGHGTSSEMEQFLTWTTRHRPDLAARVIGAVVVDERHSTPAQLLARASEFYAQVSPTRLV